MVGCSAGTGGQVVSPGPQPPAGGGVNGGISASVADPKPLGPGGLRRLLLGCSREI